MTSSLTVRGLAVGFGGRLAVEGVDLDVLGGTSVALAGPSGSGKTVLLHALAGLLPLTRGEILLNGTPVDPDRDRTSGTFGVILQSQGLASGLTVEENICLPLQARGLLPEEIAARCRAALADVDLEGAAGRLIDELSGGQRQRVGVARALAGQPVVLVADEPTAELDPVNRERVLAALLDPSLGRIVCIASNDPEIVEACDQALHLRDGHRDGALAP